MATPEPGLLLPAPVFAPAPYQGKTWAQMIPCYAFVSLIMSRISYPPGSLDFFFSPANLLGLPSHPALLLSPVHLHPDWQEAAQSSASFRLWKDGARDAIP